MGFWQKFTDKIKIKSENETYCDNVELEEINNNQNNNSPYDGINFCVFVSNSPSYEQDILSSPFTYASLISIDNDEAVFYAESLTAYSPFDNETEVNITTDVNIKFMLSSVEERTCSCSSCSNKDGKDLNINKLLDDVQGEFIEAKVLWVKNNTFSCYIINNNKKVIDIINKIAMV